MTHKKRARVSGGAGLIGSHIADLFARESWRVPMLDNLEPNTHKGGRPAWINPAAQFVQGDFRHLPIKKWSIASLQAVYSEFCAKGIVHRVRIS
jgi:dTDP-L-rhamnose 4-epimerase